MTHDNAHPSHSASATTEQPTNAEDAAKGDSNAIRHIAYAEGYRDGKARQGEPVAVVVSKFGDPEAFGEREVKIIADLSKIPYDTPLFAIQPHDHSALNASLSAGLKAAIDILNAELLIDIEQPGVHKAIRLLAEARNQARKAP